MREFWKVIMNRIDTHVASQVADVVRTPQSHQDRQLQSAQALHDRVESSEAAVEVEAPLKAWKKASLN